MKMNRTDAARVKKLNAQVIELRNQIEGIEAPYRQREAEAMVGLCFKVRNNYSCPEKPSDYWWRYVKVTRVGEHGSLYCLHFEVDKDGNAFVRLDDYHHPNAFGGYQTVSPDEFDREFSKMLMHIERCHAAATTKQEEGETLPGILCPNGGYCDYPSNPCFTCRRPRPSKPSGDGSQR